MIKLLICIHFIALLLFIVALFVTIPTHPENFLILIAISPMIFAIYLIFSD